MNQSARPHAARGHLTWFDLRWKDEFVEREDTVWSLLYGLISTFKYTEENGTELKGFFSLVWFFTEYDFEVDVSVKTGASTVCLMSVFFQNTNSDIFQL